jgi:hypothetical protein
MLAPGVVADIVSVQTERHGLQKLKCGAVKNLHCAVATAGDEQAIGGRVVVRSLRLVQIPNGVHLPACLQINHLEGVIVKRSRKEAPALHIDAEMIHAPFDLR